MLPRAPRTLRVALVGVIASLAVPAALVAAPLGEVASFPAFGGASSITSGPDGNMWVIEGSGNTIGRINPTNGALTTFTVPGIGVSLQQLTAGPDGNLWFTDDGTNSIGRVTPAGEITVFPQPAVGGTLLGAITAGPDGRIWFAHRGIGDNAVGRVTTAGADGDLTVLGGNWVLGGLAPGGGAGVYYNENVGSGLGRITTGLQVSSLPGTGQGQAMITAPDGSLWYSPTLSNAIRQWSPATQAQVNEFALPAAGGTLTWGADGNLWVGLTNASTVRRLSTAGQATDLPSGLPAGFFQGMSPGPDGSIWYSTSGDRVARIGTGVGAPTQVTIAESGGTYVCTTNALPTAMGTVSRVWSWTVAGRAVTGFTGDGTRTAYTPPASDVGQAIACAVRDTYNPSLIQMGFGSDGMVITAPPATPGGSGGAAPGPGRPAALRASWKVTGRRVASTFRPVTGAPTNRITATPAAKGGKARAGRCTVRGRARTRTVTCTITLPAGTRRWRVTTQARSGATVVAQAQRVISVR